MAPAAAPGRPSLCGVWRRTAAEFVADTNVAGVNNAGRARHPFRRLVWSCLFLAGLCVTVSDVVSLVNKYLSYPVTTDFTIKYQNSVTFPAVTVCNQNSVMCSSLLELLFQAPDNAQLQDLADRSDCVISLEDACMFFHHSFVTYHTLPDLLRNLTCFANTSDNCCSLVDSGKQLSVDVASHLEVLGCELSQMRNCAMDQNGGQDGGQGGGQGESQDSGQDGGQGNSSQSQGERKKRSVLEPMEQRLVDWIASKRDGLVRKRREAAESPADTPGDEDAEMGIDTEYDDKMDFYARFMNLSLGIRHQIGQKFNSFIKSCTFNGRDCLKDTFFDTINTPTYGNCFTFNSNISYASDRNAGKRNSTMMGPENGLSLVLFLDTGNYMPSTVSQTTGARVMIHSSDVTPLVAESGLDIGPASVNSISISETVIIRMPSPYQSFCVSQWTDAGVEPYSVNPTTDNVTVTGARFTLPECHRICLQLRIVRACGCHLALYPLTFAVEGQLQDIGPTCDLSYGTEDANCTAEVTDATGTSEDLNCTCKNPCYEVVHQPQLSVASWPQGRFLGNLLRKVEFLDDEMLDDDAVVTQWGSQFTKLNVYFRDINTAAVTESATYTYTSFISSLGGALSLYLGIALILLIELLELFFFLIFNSCRLLCGCYQDDVKQNKAIPASSASIRVFLSAKTAPKDPGTSSDAFY